MSRLCVLAGLVVCLTGMSWANAVAQKPEKQPTDKTAVDIRSEDGKILMGAEQIRAYDWDTHTLTLEPKVREKLAVDLRKTTRLVPGVPFTIAVGGKSVYRGHFTTNLSSATRDTAVIVIDAQKLDPTLGPDQVRIQLGYPGPEFFKGQDPRPADAIREALKATGKLARKAP